MYIVNVWMGKKFMAVLAGVTVGWMSYEYEQFRTSEVGISHSLVHTRLRIYKGSGFPTRACSAAAVKLNSRHRFLRSQLSLIHIQLHKGADVFPPHGAAI